jgi:FkbM family methyltransferase
MIDPDNPVPPIQLIREQLLDAFDIEFAIVNGGGGAMLLAPASLKAAGDGVDPRVAQVMSATIGIDMHNHVYPAGREPHLQHGGQPGRPEQTQQAPELSLADELKRSGLTAVCASFVLDFAKNDKPSDAQDNFLRWLTAIDAQLEKGHIRRALNLAHGRIDEDRGKPLCLEHLEEQETEREDIGAYIGDFTMQVARACPRGRIFAVEPNSANVRMIETQMALNHISHVETVRAAVGGTNGRGGLTGDGMGARVTEGDDEAVEVVTLESLMNRYDIDSVDLLKLDCEGAEWDILPAAERVLPRVRQICMEFHCERGWTAVKLADWLRSRGFIVSHTGGAWNGLLWATRSTSRC